MKTPNNFLTIFSLSVVYAVLVACDSVSSKKEISGENCVDLDTLISATLSTARAVDSAQLLALYKEMPELQAIGLDGSKYLANKGGWQSYVSFMLPTNGHAGPGSP